MQIRLKTVTLMLPGLIFIAACGQKGPLYLPGDTLEVPTEIPQQPASQPQEEDEDEKDSSDQNR